MHDIGVDADRGVVDEGLAIDLGEIDGACLALGDDFGGLLEVQGDAKVLGKVIQGAERQDAERNAGLGKHAGHGANAAVAAANHHCVDLG